MTRQLTYEMHTCKQSFSPVILKRLEVAIAII